MRWIRHVLERLGRRSDQERDTDLVTVLGPIDRATLAIAQSALWNEGIPCLVPPTAPFRTIWGSAAQPMESETLQVLRRDVIRARGVLAETLGVTADLDEAWRSGPTP